MMQKLDIAYLTQIVKIKDMLALGNCILEIMMGSDDENAKDLLRDPSKQDIKGTSPKLDLMKPITENSAEALSE